MSMCYGGRNHDRFKPLVNEALAFWEVTNMNDFVVDETYLVEIVNHYTSNFVPKMIKQKGTFVKIFQSSNTTHIIFKNKKGGRFSAPAQESRFYKSFGSTIVTRFQQKAMIHFINNGCKYRDYNEDENKNTVGYAVGYGWICNDEVTQEWLIKEISRNENPDK